MNDMEMLTAALADINNQLIQMTKELHEASASLKKSADIMEVLGKV